MPNPVIIALAMLITLLLAKWLPQPERVNEYQIVDFTAIRGKLRVWPLWLADKIRADYFRWPDYFHTRINILDQAPIIKAHDEQEALRKWKEATTRDIAKILYRHAVVDRSIRELVEGLPGLPGDDAIRELMEEFQIRT